MLPNYHFRYLMPPESALFKGMLLRESLKQECLALKFLNSNLSTYKCPQEALGLPVSDDSEAEPSVYSLLDMLLEFVQAPNYDIASDSFASLKEILTRHKDMVAEFLETNYEKVPVLLYVKIFTKLHAIIMTANYLTKRQVLKVRLWNDDLLACWGAFIGPFKLWSDVHVYYLICPHEAIDDSSAGQVP